MPALRDYRFANGKIMNEVDPTYEQRYRAMLIATADYPEWHSDPTYNLRKHR